MQFRLKIIAGLEKSYQGEVVFSPGYSVGYLAQEAGPGQQLTVEEADGEYFITCGHEMTKEHFISFLAVLTGDSLLMKKLYPEWAMQARVPCTKGALLVRNI